MKKLSLKSLLVFPIITLTALLQFCGPKATKSTVSASYQEDLSVYRDAYTISESTDDINDVVVEEEVAVVDIEPTHGIGTELDSVTNIIIDSRKDVKTLDGFTIQLYSGNNRDKANEFKMKAYEILEGTRPTLSYEQPNYKVRIGQYYSRIEANEDFNILQESFSRAVLIPTQIKIDVD